MSDDTIKRSDAIKAVSKVDDYGDGIGFEVRSHCLVELELVPSADRPQGEWIDKGGYAICSNCRAHSEVQYDGVPVPLKTRYCPNCGAQMKGADDE